MNTNLQIRFRWILPLAQLLVCLVLLWPLRGFIALQIQGVAHAIWPARVQEPVYFSRPTSITVPPQPTPGVQDHDRSRSLVELRVQIPALLNFPCAFLGLLRTGPVAMFRELLKAITFPIVGIFFWWLVGRSAEALAAARRRALSPVITWAEILVGSLLILGDGGMLVGMVVDPSFREDLVFPWRLATLAAGLWVLLGALIIMARTAQWRLRRGAKVFA
jgi:hypothetical protein